MSPETIQDRVVRSLYLVSPTPVTIRDRRRRRRARLHRGARRGLPRRQRSSRVYLRSYPNRALGRPARRQRRRDPRQAAQAKSLHAASRRGPASARAGWRPSTTATCAGATASSGWSSTRSGNLKGKRRTRAAGDRPDSQAVARPRPAARRAGGLQRSAAAQPGGVRRPGPAQRRDPRHGLLPDLRPRRARQAHLAAGATTRCSARGGRPLFNRATPAPIPPARRSSRSRRWPALQAGHHDARHASSTTPAASPSARRADVPERRRRPAYGAGRPAPGAAGVLRRLLLHDGPGPDAGPGQLDPDAGRTSSASAGTRASTCPGGAPGMVPDRAWRARDRRRGDRCRKKPHGRPSRAAWLRRLRPAAVVARATTSTSRSARATCRPRRCRWPSPTRRSPTAARSRARTSASRSRTARAACSSGSSRRAARQVRIDPAYRQVILAGPARRGQRSRAGRRPTSSPAGTRAASPSSARRAPPSAPAGRTSPGTSPTPTMAPQTTGRSWSRSTVERGGFGAGRGGARSPPDPRQVVRRQKAKLRRREVAGPVNTSRRSTTQTGRRRGGPPRRGAGAALRPACSRWPSSACAVCSLVDDPRRDAPTTSRAQPQLLRHAPGHLLRASGSLLAIVLSRIDYSRLRELKYGLYGLLIVSILAVLALGSGPAARAARSSCRSSPSRPPSWARCC